MLNPAIALYLWPLVAVALFAQLAVVPAVIWSMLLSFLILPSEFKVDLPGLPPIDKVTLPNLMLLLLVVRKGKLNLGAMPTGALLLVALLAVGVVGTTLTNGDPVWTGDGDLPGLTDYDALASLVNEGLMILPLFIGWRWFASASSHRRFLQVMFFLGLAYSLLMLLEVRLSPQLHRWVYGYFPTSFSQQIRQGGFRPVVFFKHGLWCAFFGMSVILAGSALWREERAARRGRQKSKQEGKLLGAVFYMYGVLVLCKSVGSLVYASVLAPLILLFSVTAQLRVAICFAVLAFGYPVLRGAGWVPVDDLLGFVSSYSAERAQSLETRFTNEGELLDHAESRLLFGWGGWGRNRVHDLDTGEDVSITDGYWILTIGAWGWAGYAARFGLLGLPVLLIWRRARRSREKVPYATAALTVLLSISMVELLPNSVFMPWTWLIVGGLFGYATRPAGAPGGVSAPPGRALS